MVCTMVVGVITRTIPHHPLSTQMNPLSTQIYLQQKYIIINNPFLCPPLIPYKKELSNNIIYHNNTMPYIEFSNPVRFSFSKTLPQPRAAFSMKSLFSNNAQVCYKPNSLSYGGVGSMRNSRAKARKA